MRREEGKPLFGSFPPELAEISTGLSGPVNDLCLAAAEIFRVLHCSPEAATLSLQLEGDGRDAKLTIKAHPWEFTLGISLRRPLL